MELRLTGGIATLSVSRIHVETAIFSSVAEADCTDSNLATVLPSSSFALVDWNASGHDAVAHPLGEVAHRLTPGGGFGSFT